MPPTWSPDPGPLPKSSMLPVFILAIPVVVFAAKLIAIIIVSLPE